MNVFLTDYSNDDVGNMMFSGSVTSKYDDGGNLLIDKNGTASADIAASIVLSSIGFDNTKVEAKYDVGIKELN